MYHDLTNNKLKNKTMTTKDLDGFTIRRTGEESPYYLRHQYLVDGNNREGDPEQGLWTLEEIATCRTKKEALSVMRRHKHLFDKISIWDEWIEEDIDARYGRPILGDTVSQTLEEYVNGKLVNKDKML